MTQSNYDAATSGVIVCGERPAGTDTSRVVALYQPIIGAQALAVWATLAAWWQATPQLSHRKLNQRLWLQTNLNQTEINEACRRLEAVALLKTWQQHDALGYVRIYQLQPVLSAQAFFNDDLLATVLAETVGDTAFAELRRSWVSTPLDLSEAQEVSADFFSVYGTHIDHVQPQATEQPQAKPAAPAANAPQFDDQVFYQLLSESYVKKTSVTRIWRQLQQLIAVYGLNEVTLVDVLRQSADDNGVVTLARVRAVLHQAMQPVVAVPSSQTQPQPSHQASGAPAQLLTAARQLTPQQFLTTLRQQQGGVVTSSEMYMLEDLSGRVADEVFNVILAYLITQQHQSTVNRATVERIMNRLMQAKITTAAAAAQAIVDFDRKKAQQQRRPRFNQRPTGRVEHLPEWARKNKEQEQAKKNTAQAQRQVSPAEARAKLKRLQELRKRQNK